MLFSLDTKDEIVDAASLVECLHFRKALRNATNN